MKATAAVLLILGAAVAALGLYLGLSTVTRSGVECGTAFDGTTAAAARADTRADVRALTNGDVAAAGTHRLATACENAVTDRRTLTELTIVPGGALAIAGVVVLAMAARSTGRASSRRLEELAGA